MPETCHLHMSLTKCMKLLIPYPAVPDKGFPQPLQA